mmetsp:Transcript_70460/g.127043  ORF Transcript_70460/g.127043 Transcript_70460/m.127043 type:complete len:87 (-) Transcript_70460:223-483(-)
MLRPEIGGAPGVETWSSPGETPATCAAMLALAWQVLRPVEAVVAVVARGAGLETGFAGIVETWSSPPETHATNAGQTSLLALRESA